MGTQILMLVALTIIMMRVLNLFGEWYTFFLKRRRINVHLITLLNRLTIIILAYIFWGSLIARGGMAELNKSHFLFALFTFSIYKLIKSFRKNNNDS